MPKHPEITLISLGTTPGWRRTDEAFAQLVRDAGAQCHVERVRLGVGTKLRRSMMLTDLVEALAARGAARRIDSPRAIVFSTVTAALLQRDPGVPHAVRFDAPAALNRPGVGGAWQRRRERGVLARADLLLPLGRAGADAIPLPADRRPPVAIVPVTLDVPRPAPAERDIDAVAYAGNPRKRGLDVLCRAWAAAAPAGARLVVCGIDAKHGRRALERAAASEPAGIEWAGALERDDWLATLRRARLFVNASRYEDYGIAPLEALAAGTPLATVPSPGPYEALPLARALAPQLVSADGWAMTLAEAIRAGLGLGADERADYAARAEQLLAPYRPQAARQVMEREVLPALGDAARRGRQ
jgi:glycosyltransferase involved in cell wall biosynthesis